MPPKQTRPRHAAPKEPVNRTVLLPAVLLAAAGSAFAGLAVVPAAAEQAPVERVVAASTFTPVDVPAPGAELPTTEDLVTGREDAAKQAAAAKAAEQAAAAAAAAEATRVAEEAAAAAAAAAAEAAASERASRSARGDAADGAYVRPGEGRLTSGFGRRWGRLHAGIDLAAGTGSPIRAVAAGKVVSAGRESGYGNAVRIRHADGTETVYAHLSRILVTGGSVSAGEQIGKEGNTGRSTGPHLHFEVRVGGSPVNPVTWLRSKGVRV